MEIWMISIDDGFNVRYATFSTKGKAKDYFRYIMRDYWIEGEPTDANGRTPEECIDDLNFSNGDVVIFGRSMEMDSWNEVY